ncbi:hypothetical protein [Streptomyces sp. NPDC051776]|uniref:hypothetical protein n=1 Tax=Streptomyces sp. NPDC051776 TaxID=3155414 RepID=UPI00342485C8
MVEQGAGAAVAGRAEHGGEAFDVRRRERAGHRDDVVIDEVLGPVGPFGLKC